MKLFRSLLALVATLALLGGGMHASAMAGAPSAPLAAMQADASPCHNSAPEKPAKPDKSDCCANGCDGQCTATGAFFAAPASHRNVFVRTVLDAPTNTHPVSVLTTRSERPPKS